MGWALGIRPTRDPGLVRWARPKPRGPVGLSGSLPPVRALRGPSRTGVCTAGKSSGYGEPVLGDKRPREERGVTLGNQTRPVRPLRNSVCALSCRPPSLCSIWLCVCLSVLQVYFLQDYGILFPVRFFLHVASESPKITPIEKRQSHYLR